MSISSVIVKALERPLCDNCLGRLFAKIGTGYSNRQRGQAARYITNTGLVDVSEEQFLVFLKEDAAKGTQYSGECSVCGNLLDEHPKYVEMVSAALEKRDFDTFLIGTRIDPEILEAEEELWADLGIESYESIKSEINRLIGKGLEAGLGKTVEFEYPDIMVIVDTEFDNIEIDVRALFIYGRYRKLVRGIPQTRWPCRKCKGSGCESCNGTGKMYQESVEELVAHELMKVTGARDEKFHGMGREDIDALMLGNGRPFVLEFKEPARRHIDFDEIEKIINQHAKGKVEVCGLRGSSKREVQAIKDARSDKTYRVVVRLEREVEQDELKSVIAGLKGITLEQQTPTRVAHRRADLVRKRDVLDIRLGEVNGRNAEILVRAQAGTYIKQGRIVHLTMDLKILTISGGGGNAIITGLPFVPSTIITDNFIFPIVYDKLNIPNTTFLFRLLHSQHSFVVIDVRKLIDHKTYID